MNPHGSGVTVVTEPELRKIVGMDAEAISAVERAFVWAAEGRAQSPPIMHIAIPENNGDVDIKSAYIRGERYFAVKIAAGFYDNPKIGFPTGSALVVLIDSRTGRPEMIYLDNGYLTDVRTAAAGAIAVRHLARESASRVGIIGCGVQARYQLRAIAVGRKLTEVRVAARDAAKAARYAEEMARELALAVTVTSVEELAAHSDIIVTTTPSTIPVLAGVLLQPGQTIVAMGSDSPTKRELDAAAFERAAVVVCDNRRQCEVLGELHHAQREGAIATCTRVLELGEICAGRRRGREDDREIILCDLTGMGAQDSAIGLYARERVVASRMGWQAPA